ncbi:MAG: hypothetical protein KDA75_02755, partial [Planctomycetaceae bacterium]|nr:hypothetical protein [Planctomycetaceae bacterium]
MRLALTPRADTTTRDAATDVCSHDGCEPIRVCFLTPSLVMGGAERWMLSLARYCNPERIQWAGTVITRYAAVKPEITSQLSSCMPIAGPPERGESDSADVVRCPSLTDAVEQVVRDADVMVAWGVPDIGQLTGRLSIPIVYVSHGAGDWTARALR